MKLDLSHFMGLAGLGVAAYLILKLKKQLSCLQVSAITHDIASKSVKLTLVNSGAEPIYVRPALSLMSFRHSAEAVDGEDIGMAPAQAGVRKSTSLLAQSDQPLLIGPKSEACVTYDASSGGEINILDTFIVDFVYGLSVDRMEARAQSKKAVIETLGDGFVQKEICVEASMGNSSNGNVPENVEWHLPTKPSRGDDEYEDDGMDVEFVEGEGIEIKPKHQRILGVLGSEKTMTPSELSQRLSRPHKAVSEDLRYLVRGNLVGRVKSGKTFKYHVLSMGERVVLGDGPEEQQNT